MAKELFTPDWFPFYQRKFTSATQLYNAECIGTYIVLLNYQWDNGGLPNDIKVLKNLSKSSTRSVQKVLEKFVLGEDGLYWNKRLEEIRQDQMAKYLKSKEKADKANEIIKAKKAAKNETLNVTNNDTLTQRIIDKDKDKELSIDSFKEIDTNVSKKKKISLEEFRLIVQQSISTCTFTEKFTPKAQEYFLSWATTENKITSLKKIKTELAKYFQNEIDYLSKYAPNQIEYMLEQASRKCYLSYVEKNIPEPQRVIKPQFKELYSDPEPVKPREPIQFIIPDEFK